jgi:hypothetical protein
VDRWLDGGVAAQKKKKKKKPQAYADQATQNEQGIRHSDHASLTKFSISIID